MKTKTLPLKTLLAIFFLVGFIHILPANDSPRPIQRFSWVGDSYALRYEVIIINEMNKTMFQEFTLEPLIEISLPPGNYQIQVTPYDFRNMPAGNTGWIAFNVPVSPVPGHIASEDSSLEYSGADQSGQIAKSEDTHLSPVIQDSEPLYFNYYLSAALMPFIPVYYGEGPVFGSKPSLLGAAARFAMVSGKDKFIVNPGFDFAVSWYKVDGNNSITATVNFLIQKYHINDETAITFRFGTGFVFLPGQEVQVSEAQRVHLNTGLSFLWFAFDPLFFEAGLDYTHYFTDYPSGCFRPWIGAGIRF